MLIKFKLFASWLIFHALFLKKITLPKNSQQDYYKLNLILYLPVNNFSVMSEFFLGWTSTTCKQGLLNLAQGHSAVTLHSLEPATPPYLVKHSTAVLPEQVLLAFQTVWIQIRPKGTYLVRHDLGLSCLQRLSADDNYGKSQTEKFYQAFLS